MTFEQLPARNHDDWHLVQTGLGIACNHCRAVVVNYVDPYFTIHSLKLALDSHWPRCTK